HHLCGGEGKAARLSRLIAALTRPLRLSRSAGAGRCGGDRLSRRHARHRPGRLRRSEEHTSELQSLRHLVCRLLLEKKKNTQINVHTFVQKTQKLTTMAGINNTYDNAAVLKLVSVMRIGIP